MALVKANQGTPPYDEETLRDLELSRDGDIDQLSEVIINVANEEDDDDEEDTESSNEELKAHRL